MHADTLVVGSLHPYVSKSIESEVLLSTAGVGRWWGGIMVCKRAVHSEQAAGSTHPHETPAWRVGGEAQARRGAGEVFILQIGAISATISALLRRLSQVYLPQRSRQRSWTMKSNLP